MVAGSDTTTYSRAVDKYERIVKKLCQPEPSEWEIPIDEIKSSLEHS